MFHLHTFDGIHNNITLEEIKKHSRVRQVEKKSKSRKYISDRDDPQEGHESTLKYNYAIDAYKKTIDLKDEREQIFHAYQIMSSPVKTIGPDSTITTAWKIFNAEKVKYMPVVSGDEIMGIVSTTDLLKHILIKDHTIEHAHDLTVTSIMSDEIITAEPVTDIRRIAKAMFEHHIGTMPITHDNKLVGIITRSDILHAIIHHASLKLWA